MPSCKQYKMEILHLLETFKDIRPATMDDVIYCSFSNPPILDADGIDEGMYWTVNTKMYAFFAEKDIKNNVLTRPYGLKLVMRWLDQAQKHETWDKTSDQLLNLKMKRIHTYMIGSTATNNNPKGKKRRVVSQPSPNKEPNKSISNIDKTAVKFQQNLAPSEVVNISSNDDKDQQRENISTSISRRANKVEKKESSTKIMSVTDVLQLCPLSKGNQPCTKYQVETAVLGNKYFWCHCSNKRLILPHGPVETAEDHWKSKKCRDKTRDISSAVLTSFYKKIPVDPKTTNREVPCPGLTDATWVRKKVQNSIAYFLFGNKTSELSLTKYQKARLISALDSQEIWEVKRHGKRSGVYSKNCKRTVLQKKNLDDVPCVECESIKGNSSLKSALNHQYTDNDHLKFINHSIMTTDTFHATMRKYSDSRNGDFAIHAQNVVQGLFKQAAGKSLQGLQIDAYLANTLTTLGAMS
ncbi:hypothetical protein DFH28DRAFT_1095028 [Melampsora americana]|nr:hypothetical protein DFH28DRAFT_1095028 [Melampsora americana]